MARNSRHNKIIEIISTKEIETQDELVKELKDAKFDVTQATISRDIKELGLIKILTDSKKYKYATAASGQVVSDKAMSLYLVSALSSIVAQNLVVVKTVKGTAGFVASVIESCGLPEVLGVTYGNDTVLLVTANNDDALTVLNNLKDLV